MLYPLSYEGGTQKTSAAVLGGRTGMNRLRALQGWSVASPERHPTSTDAERNPVIRDQLVDALRAALVALEVEPLPETINLERPARREHGDWSSNVALATARKAGRNPRELARDLADHLGAEGRRPPHVTAVEIAGPGFVNFRLADSWLHDVLTAVVGQGTAGYARHALGEGTTYNVEWVSANPTGPLHVGHGRNAAYGDSVVRLLQRTGHTVIRECYLNDRGTQMQHYVDSLLARKKGEDPPADGYHGEYIAEWAGEMPDDADPLEWGEARAVRDQLEVLGRMGVAFDVWFSERSLVEDGRVDETLADLRARDVAYDADGAVWLRSSVYGDDKDRVLVKTDGEYTYLLPDIAYHRDKFGRADRLIDVWGADHHGYVHRMKAAVQALGHRPDDLQVEVIQMVKLLRDGEEVRLSKRAGDIIELRDLIDEVGPDAARLTFLLQGIETAQTFDIDVVTSQAMDNPVFYVQMAYARIRSIKRKADELGVTRQPLEQTDLGRLGDERELDILRALSELPDVVLTAAADRAPHRIATWVRQLAGAFHGFYHDCYVISDQTPPELTQARLWLVEAAEIGLAIGLDLLGVSAPESM
jgi:arginyl-tRNA synthetase